MHDTYVDHADASLPLIPLTTETFAQWKEDCPQHWRNRLEEQGFRAHPDSWIELPGTDGFCQAILVGYAPRQPIWMLAQVAVKLRPGFYHVSGSTVETLLLATLGWGLAQYRYDRYRPGKESLPTLVWPAGVDREAVRRMLAAQHLGRDLINTPAADLLPDQLVAAVDAMAAPFAAQMRVMADPAQLATEYPCVQAVGAASTVRPRVIELQWGDRRHPHVVLVGKGVCFDSGGLDLKPSRGMRLMKKDMGGAAIAIALAQWIMTRRLPVYLTLLIGAVENAIGPGAMRPGDVLTARNGKTIEIDNTDAEGRLVLADLLVRAGELHPDVLIDLATLTGAARTAVGTEISALFTTDATWEQALHEQGLHWDDPVWPLPLHAPYRHLLDSDIAEIANSSSSPYAGAITAALFLQEFVPEGVPWLHLDIMAWNLRARPGRPKGGEAMGLRALIGLLEQRYGMPHGS